MQNNFKVDFIGVGAPKSGTTWIATCLSEHPDICLSKPKEIHFFNKTHMHLQSEINSNYLKNIEWYKNHFSHCDNKKIKGEFSTNYLCNKESAKIIKKYFPQTKIIISLRNPVNRLYSYFLHIKYKTSLKRKNIQRLKSFEKELKKNPNFIKTGFYDEFITEYLEIFDRKNILILIYEEMIQNPKQTMKKLYSFLDVKSDFIPKSLKVNVNPTSQKVNQVKYEFEIFKNKLMNSKLKKRIINFLKITKLNKLILFIFINPLDKITKLISKHKTTYPKLDNKTRKYLQKIYEPHNKNLEKILNKKLDFWN